MPKLILIGFMGCGKSTYGRSLASHLGVPFLDTDELIEKRSGKRISEIFAGEGEEAFRDMESAVIEELSESREDAVISSGGGLPVRERNREALKRAGKTVYLKAGEAFLLERLKNNREERPMIAGGDLSRRIHELLTQREELYREAADVILTLEGKTQETVSAELLEVWKALSPPGEAQKGQQDRKP